MDSDQKLKEDVSEEVNVDLEMDDQNSADVRKMKKLIDPKLPTQEEIDHHCLRIYRFAIGVVIA